MTTCLQIKWRLEIETTCGQLSKPYRNTEPVLLYVYGPRNWFQGMNSASLCSLAGQYENPIPPWFLAPIDFLKISALYAVCKSLWLSFLHMINTAHPKPTKTSVFMTEVGGPQISSQIANPQILRTLFPTAVERCVHPHNEDDFCGRIRPQNLMPWELGSACDAVQTTVAKFLVPGWWI
jgi:hypothetical protein